MEEEDYENFADSDEEEENVTEVIKDDFGKVLKELNLLTHKETISSYFKDLDISHLSPYAIIKASWIIHLAVLEGRTMINPKLFNKYYAEIEKNGFGGIMPQFPPFMKDNQILQKVEVFTYVKLLASKNSIDLVTK